MPTESPLVQRVSDWSNGPWGELGPWEGPKRGFLFDSQNLVPYTNGMIGPRHLGAITDNVFDAEPQNYRGMASLVQSFNHTDPVGIYHYFFRSDTTVARLNALTGAITTLTITTIPSANLQGKLNGDITSGRNTFSQYGDDDLITSAYGRIGQLLGTPAHATQPYASSFAPTGIIEFRDRYWAWGDPTNSNRIMWSAPGMASSWAAVDYFDIGAATLKGIKGVWTLYDTMLIAMEDYSWWSFRFSNDPAFGELKYIGSYIVPDYCVNVVNNGRSLAFSGRDEGIVIVTPDGIDTETFAHMRRNGWLYGRRGVYCRQTDASMITTSQGPTFFGINGRWYEQLPVGGAVRDAFEYSPTEFGLLVVTPDGAVETSERDFYGYAIDSEMSLSKLSEGISNGRLDLAGWRAPDGALAAIKKVTIDFEGLANTSTFTVNAMYSHDGVLTGPTTIGILDSAAVENGMNRFVVHPTRLPMSTNFQVYLTLIGYCAISEVTVHYDTQTQEIATDQLVSV